MLQLKQFKSENCLSYLIWDRASHEALVVDPSVDAMMEYREFIAEHALKISFVVDLRLHSGHFSATYLLRDLSTSIAMSHRTRSMRPTLKLQEGSVLKLGANVLRCLEVPGCSPDGIALLADTFVLTGDVLLIGSTGQANEPDSNAENLWNSLDTLLKLPPETLIFPGLDQTDLLASSIEVEKKNRDPQFTQERFIAAESENRRVNWDEESKACLEFNLAAAPELPGRRIPRTEGRLQSLEDARHSSITVEKYRHKLGQPGAALIDVRETAEFAEGHIPGAKNIPLAKIPFELELLRPYARVYVSCLIGKRGERAAKTLSYLGLRDVVNLSGGFKAWSNAEYPIEK